MIIMPKNSIALYISFDDDFIERRKKNYKNPLRLQVIRDVTIVMLKYAYKKYYGIDIDPQTLNSGNYLRQKEYGGLYYDFASVCNSVIVAVGEKRLAVGKSIRSLKDDWKPCDDLFHTNEHKIYEQSGFSADVLCSLWAQKEAYNKLHGITNPSDDKFDNSFQKDYDSTAGEYSLRRFDYGNYAIYVAVTDKASFEECTVTDVLKDEK